MVCVANYDRAATIRKPFGHLRQPLLVNPRIDFGVVLDKAVIAVSKCVGRVEVNDVPTRRIYNNSLEVSTLELSGAKCSGGFSDRKRCRKVNVSLVAVRDVECPVKVLAVESVEREGSQVEKACGSLSGISRYIFANPVVRFLVVLEFAQLTDNAERISLDFSIAGNQIGVRIRQRCMPRLQGEKDGAAPEEWLEIPAPPFRDEGH